MTRRVHRHGGNYTWPGFVRGARVTNGREPNVKTAGQRPGARHGHQTSSRAKDCHLSTAFVPVQDIPDVEAL